MNIAFNEQIGIITGAASGLGAAIAQKLSAKGVKLALFDKDKKGLEKIRESLPGSCTVHALDIANEEQVAASIEETGNLYGRIDLLVNSAGITGKTNIRSHEVELENLRQVFEVNLIGSFLTSKYVLPWMLKNNYGRILHVASVSGKEGNAGMTAYSSSKAALIGMTKVQGKEYAENGITVNAIAPAVMQTPMVDALPAEQVKYMTDKIPMKRCCTLNEAADSALFILSPNCSFTTGFTFDLTGGRATY